MSRLFELGFLSLYAFVAATAVAARMRYTQRAETLLAAIVLWNALILLPIHVLGLTNWLTANRLALASLLTSSAALGASFARAATIRQHANDVRHALLGCLRLPTDALAIALRAKSLVFIGVVAVLLILPWTVWLSYLVPSDSWDGIWYHEAMVGYAIQNRGYAPISLPANLLQQANGYPRNCEMTNLWFVIFSDRKLLEAPQSFMAVAMILAMYLIARRFTEDRVTAIGLGCALPLVPGALLELRSTYIDVQVTAFLLAAVHFVVTRQRMRIRDGWMAGLALALTMGSKSVALAWVPLLAAPATMRLVAEHWRRRLGPALATIAGGAVLIGAMGSLTYVRNWIHYHNPIWPLAYDNVRFRIHWAGVYGLDSMDVNKPLKDVYSSIASVPVPGHDFADTRVYGYGFAIPFLLLPLDAVLLVVLTIAGVRWAAQRLVLHPAAQADARIPCALVLAAVFFAMAYVSPGLWVPRYNIHLVAGLLFVIGWATGYARAPRLGDGVASFTIIASLVSLWWAQPGWGMDIQTALEFAKLPADRRAAHAPAEWAIDDPVAEARERELGPGAVLAFTDDVAFPGQLWNENYSNRLEYVPTELGPQGALERLEQIHARWFTVGPQSALYSTIRAHPERWQEVGRATRTLNPPIAFRRVGS
ncbi:MAG TPA: hypothetical protein VGY54_28115 [Polyangiaceae bacterium]|nr:hypothetical protein [Polyangiaceae bacterium]